MKKLIAAAGLLVASSAVFAQSQTSNALSNLYGEVGYHRVEIKNNAAPGFEPKQNVITGLVGYKFHPNLSAELMLGTGLSSTDTTIGGTTVSSKVDNSYGVMLRPSFAFNEKVEGFVRLGYGRTKVTASAPGVSASSSDSSVIWGLGANYYFTKTVYGQLSYTSFYDKSGTTGRGLGASVGFKF